MTDREKALAYFRNREAQIPMPGARAMYQEAIKALEQPEVIRCNGCKHMITHEGYGYLGEPAYTCEGNMEGWVLPDSFCSNAERKDGD